MNPPSETTTETDSGRAEPGAPEPQRAGEVLEQSVSEAREALAEKGRTGEGDGGDGGDGIEPTQDVAGGEEKPPPADSGEGAEGEPATTGTEGDAKESPGESPSEERELQTQFRLTRDGEEIDLAEAPDGLLDMEISYKANGEERTKRLDELVRVAQTGHMTEEKISTLKEQRDEVAREHEELSEEAQALRGDRDLFLKALRDKSGETFKTIQEKFLEKAGDPVEGGAEPGAGGEGTQATPEEVQQRGLELAQKHIHPFSEQVAEAYGHDNPTEITRALLVELNEEPKRFWNADTLEEIANERIPRMLEKAGYTRQGEVPRFDSSGLSEGPGAGTGDSLITPRDQAGGGGPEAEKLRKENQRLREQLESQKTQETKETLEDAPPAGGGGGAGSGGGGLEDELGLEDAETAAEIREKLQDLQKRTPRGRSAR